MESNVKAEHVQLDKKIYVRGGLKDVCQSLWYFKNNPEKEYLVHTHNPDVKQLFNFYNCKNVHYYFYQDEESHDATVEQMVKDHASENQENITDVSKSFYTSFQFGFTQEELASSLIDSFEEEKPIIGIHPFISDFSKKMYQSFDIPDISMPSEVVDNITSYDFNFLIFGQKSELSEINTNKPNIRLACGEDLLTTINLVKYCKKFIGTFSSFKTVSSSQKIPTFCIMPLRPISRGMESVFVDQYVQEKIMKPYRLEDYSSEKEILKSELEEFILK
ncbi:hypothetical protein OAE97_00970 [Verrucomicrobia bacterium]|nr:hypothetical protein [Verrucomicrobiota bacterium]